MVHNEPPGPVDADQSLGDLVSLAATHVSQLIRYEIDLAKTELRADIKRVGTAAGLGGFSFFLGCLVLVFLGFAEAAGLIAAGVWAWAGVELLRLALRLAAGCAASHWWCLELPP